MCIRDSLEAIPPGAILDGVVGRLEDLRPDGPDSCLARVSYAEEIAAGEFTQLLNVLFGNISIMPGIRVEDCLLYTSRCV